MPPVPICRSAVVSMYTSGSTGKPKGCEHRTGGYLSYVAGTSKYIQDIHPTDVYWCMADIGWITGHSYIVYGPLALAATSVLYEGVPTYPDAGRVWRIAERLDVNIFHTSPTAIRMLRKSGHDEPTKYKYHFKHMTTVGQRRCCSSGTSGRSRPRNTATSMTCRWPCVRRAFVDAQPAEPLAPQHPRFVVQGQAPPSPMARFFTAWKLKQPISPIEPTLRPLYCAPVAWGIFDDRDPPAISFNASRSIGRPE